MTPREVVTKPNADLLLSGVSADDPDFRVALWSAACTWCPNDDEARGRPRFHALAITADGYRTTTYRRLPFEDTGLYHVESPGPGLLLLVDAGNLNSPGWLVRPDGSLTELQGAVEDRTGDERLWHRCGGFAADPAAHVAPTGWCLLDPRTNTSYQAGPPWLVDALVRSAPATSPAGSDEPWGLENVWNVVPYWYAGGVLHSRDLGPADLVGTVEGLPRGQMAVWGLERAARRLTVYSSTDHGRSWQARELIVPSNPDRVGVHRTRSGALLALGEDYADVLFERPPRTIWRAAPGAGSFEVVHDESVRGDGMAEYAPAFTELDGRIWTGGLWSDDDGLTWSATSAWR